jgi:hypothetical protein
MRNSLRLNPFGISEDHRRFGLMNTRFAYLPGKPESPFDPFRGGFPRGGIIHGLVPVPTMIGGNSAD